MISKVLVICSWETAGGLGPSKSRIKGVADRAAAALSQNPYLFAGLATNDIKPLYNPPTSALLELFDSRYQNADNEVLVVWYIGHSIPHEKDDLELLLRCDAEGNERFFSCKDLLKAANKSGFKKVVMILDSCHSGRFVIPADGEGQVYCIAGTDSQYAYDANFSDCLIRTLERKLTKNDPRHDVKAKGITWRRIFEVARAEILNGDKISVQTPIARGEGNWTLIDIPSQVPTSYNHFAHPRSIYARLFFLLNFVEEAGEVEYRELVEEIGNSKEFCLSIHNELQISPDRVEDYISFLFSLGFFKWSGSNVKCTAIGRQASERAQFNKFVLNAIEETIFEDHLNYSRLEETIIACLSNYVQPTPAKLQQRYAMMFGDKFVLSDVVRFALQILPSTGRFSRGSSDALFVGEPD